MSMRLVKSAWPEAIVLIDSFNVLIGLSAFNTMPKTIHIETIVKIMTKIIARFLNLTSPPRKSSAGAEQITTQSEFPPTG